MQFVEFLIEHLMHQTQMSGVSVLPSERFSTNLAAKLLRHSAFVPQMSVEGAFMLVLSTTIIWTH